MTTKKVRSALGEIVDFNLLRIKAELANSPKPAKRTKVNHIDLKNQAILAEKENKKVNKNNSSKIVEELNKEPVEKKSTKENKE